jgi:hypothetical protein
VLHVEGPRTAGRAGKAVASSQAAATGDYRISAGRGTSARRTVANGGEALWDVVSHISSAAVVFLVRAGGGCALIILTAVRRSRGRRERGRVLTAGKHAVLRGTRFSTFMTDTVLAHSKPAPAGVA